LIEFYSDEALYIDPGNKAGLKGREGIFPYFKKLLAANPNWTWEAIEVFPTELGFILEWKATIPVGADFITERGMDVVEMKNGRISRNEVYFDRSTLIEAHRKISSLNT